MEIRDRLNAWFLRYSMFGLAHMDWVERGVAFEAYQRYRSQWLRGMMWSVALVFASGVAVDNLHFKPAAVCIAAAPLAAFAFCAIAWARYVMHWDELERRIAVESGAVSALVTAFFLVSMLWMHSAVSLAYPSPKWLLAVLVLSWAAASPLIRRRYK